MTLGNGNNRCNFSCDDIIIKISVSEKILGLTIDNNLDFSDHTTNIRKTANQKLNALFKVSAHVSLFGCSVIEKACRKSTKFKNILYV